MQMKERHGGRGDWEDRLAQCRRRHGWDPLEAFRSTGAEDGDEKSPTTR